jgi:hypothetical protein
VVRTYWFVPIFYEAIDILDLQPSARSDYVEACRPLLDGAAPLYGLPGNGSKSHYLLEAA